MEQLANLWPQLSRDPDFDAPELQAHDSADELLIETAAAVLEGAAESGGGSRLAHGGLVVIGDRHGALTLGAAIRLGAHGIRVHQDQLLAERALAQNAARILPSGAAGIAGTASDASTPLYTQHPLGPELLRDARLVLLQLPRSLAELEEIVDTIARWAHPEVVVLSGGRVKHMVRSMNEVLARGFADVTAGLAVRKARVLTARLPRSADELGPPRFPVSGTDPELPFMLAAYGATFGGATLDHGSRLLLQGLREEGWPAARRVVDLGCGNGSLAVSAALALPEAEVIATDQSAAAVRATELTAANAGPGIAERVRVLRADGAEAIPDDWADLILLNPPFHSGSTMHTGVAHRLIRSAVRALAPGGELRIVFNSSLAYRSLVERVVGETRQVSRNRSFTVLAAARR